jgi:DNA-binding CsgD family transcriptional regulator/tetratricopeptide (TPR) repeat protein
MELVERDGLLAELTRNCAAAQRESGRFVLLAGTAGVGKTAVVRALATRTSGRLRLLWGACDALSTPRALGPLQDMAASTSLEADLSPGGDRHLIFTAMLRELASGTLMIIEDVHWADEATLDLLRFLGRRIDRTRSMVVATFRADEVDSDGHHPLRPVLGDLATAPGHRRLTVEPLTLDGVGELATGRPVDPGHLFQITGGNPFYVTEVLAAPGWTVPPTVTDAVLTRAGRLAPDVRAVLEAVSVEPGPAERWLLEHLGHRAETVDATCRSGILVASGDAVTFRHELARLALLGTLDMATRQALHREVLAALEPIPRIDPARLAHHAEGAGDGDAVLRWATEAARVAYASGAHRQAAAHYERAVNRAEALDDDRLADLLERYVAELGVLDRTREAVRLRRRIVELRRASGDASATVRANADLASSLWQAGDGDAAYRLMADTVAAAAGLDRDEAAAHVYAIAGRLAMLARRGDEAVELSRTAVTIAERAGLDHVAMTALNGLGSAKLVSFEDLSGIADLERSAQLARRVASQNGYAVALSNLGSGLGEIRRYTQAAGYLTEAIEDGAEHDCDLLRYYGTAWLARIRFEQGRWAEATEIANSAMPEHGDPSPIIPIVARTVIARVRTRRGDPGARAPLDETWALARETGDLQRLWPVAAARAEVAWLEGSDPNVDEVTETLELARSLGVRWAIGELAFWAWRQGTLDQAPAEVAEPYRLHIAGHGKQAADAWAAIGCPYEQAWALADAGDERSLRAALGTFQDLGAKPLADRVRHALRQLDAAGIPTGPRASTVRHPAGLTPRQAAVLALLSEGLSDRQIAERLYISPRTASHHVGAVLRKLDSGSRSQAVARARSISVTDDPA